MQTTIGSPLLSVPPLSNNDHAPISLFNSKKYAFAHKRKRSFFFGLFCDDIGEDVSILKI